MQLNDRFEKGLDKVKSFNDRELLFKQPISEYDELNNLIREFDPFRKLWEIAMDFELDKQEYYTGTFLKLNYTVIEKRINQYYMREVSKLVKIFNDAEDDIASNVCKELKSDVEKFREKMWLIELLTTEAMIKKLNHWKDLWKECELNEIEPNDEMSL